MKALKIVGITIITLAVVASTALFLIGYFKPKQGGIRVETAPQSSVYINGSFSGRTPFQKQLEPGQISLRLEPDSSGSASLLPYETRINIVPGIETVVGREFGTTEDNSSGVVISFEKQNPTITGLVVISSPDNAQVSVDGTPRGFAPYKTSTISPAAHQVTVRAPGFIERTLTINTKSGYQLTVFAKLAKGGEDISTPALPTPTPTPVAKEYVEIQETPTGFLRVRTEPGTAGEEIAEVRPGEKYPYLATDEATGWLKIQYQDPKPGLPGGITGWVSNQYAKITQSGGSVASPSATPRI